MNRKLITLAAVPVLAFATTAFASQPVELSLVQMDQITGGGSDDEGHGGGGHGNRHGKRGGKHGGGGSCGCGGGGLISILNGNSILNNSLNQNTLQLVSLGILGSSSQSSNYGSIKILGGH